MDRQRSYVLIGHPVGHSVSPVIHRAAYDRLGRRDCTYEAVDCPNRDAVAEQVQRLRDGSLAGANVTVPYKRLALELADEATPLATKTGAANVLSMRAGRVVADNTDVAALAEELRRDASRLESALVIGNGGAALAAVVALDTLGAREIHVCARRWRADLERSAWPDAPHFSRLGVQALAWPAVQNEQWSNTVAKADVIVQATSAGMRGAAPGEAVSGIVDWRAVGPALFAYDVVYNPPETPFLMAARAHGVKASGGLGMLVGQAAEAIRLWLEVEPPRAAMQEAAVRALFGTDAR